MAIIRIYSGADGKSHFQEIVPKFEPRGDKSAGAELIPGSGIVIRRSQIQRTPRIGVDYAEHWKEKLYRFVLTG